jgi:hypothetical protein
VLALSLIGAHVIAPVPAAADTLEASAHATVAGRVPPGSIVRLRQRAEPGSFMNVPFGIARGVLVRASADSLWLLPEDRGEARAVALADVRRIEVFAGENRAGGAVIGTALGALIGMTAGLVAGTIYVDSGGSRGEHEGLAIAYLTLLGGAIGAPVGAVTGGIRGLDRWEQVE